MAGTKLALVEARVKSLLYELLLVFLFQALEVLLDLDTSLVTLASRLVEAAQGAGRPDFCGLPSREWWREPWAGNQL